MKFDSKTICAVIGFSSNSHKYGYKVFFDLLDKGIKAIPINPKMDEFNDHKVYKTLEDVSEQIDIAVFVVPPKVTESILPIVLKEGIKVVWMQPGSERDNAINFCKENNIECIHNACVMINLGGN